MGPTVHNVSLCARWKLERDTFWEILGTSSSLYAAFYGLRVYGLWSRIERSTSNYIRVQRFLKFDLATHFLLLCNGTFRGKKRVCKWCNKTPTYEDDHTLNLTEWQIKCLLNYTVIFLNEYYNIPQKNRLLKQTNNYCCVSKLLNSRSFICN